MELIRVFKQLKKEDVAIAGGKGASADIIMLNRATVDSLLPGEGSEAEMRSFASEKGAFQSKIDTLEAGLGNIYRQGRLVRASRKV